MDRSRFVRALALTIGVAGSLSSLADLAWAGQCDNCDSPTSQRCHCPPGRGLLDTLNDVAGRVVKDKPKRKSILHAFKFNLDLPTGCDKASCGCEPSCGTEPTCGTEGPEPSCGAEPSCGIEPSCGSEPTCGIEPSCGTEPTCGIEPKCGVEAVCGIEAKHNYTHATGPIQYPVHAEQRIRTESRPAQTPYRPQTPNRTPPAPEPVIPAPMPEDSTVDPFKDDTASQSRVRARAASQRITSQTGTPATPKTLKFDPQAATRAGQFGPQRAIVRKPVSMPAHGRLSDEAVAEEEVAKSVAVSSRKPRNQAAPAAVASSSPAPSVVPASASEPAKLPPLKTKEEPFDLSSSRNPLRDER